MYLSLSVMCKCKTPAAGVPHEVGPVRHSAELSHSVTLDVQSARTVAPAASRIVSTHLISTRAHLEGYDSFFGASRW